MTFVHQKLAQGSWQKLSLMEQLGNIGSEVSRAAQAENKDPVKFESAVSRALELFDLTLDDPRWKERLKEIARAREVFCDAASGGKNYRDNLKNLEKYFYDFALASRFKT